jgi:uncharacterized protein (DUF1330 family)
MLRAAVLRCEIRALPEAGLAEPSPREFTTEVLTPRPPLQHLFMRRDAMKKGFWVVAYRSISDESAIKAYQKLAVPAIQSFGGRFLNTSTSRIEKHEAGLMLPTFLIEFDSYDRALAAYTSDAYGKALAALGSGAQRDFRIIEGA